MSLDYTVRPISDRTAFRGRHEGSPFTASWADTLDVLDREIHMLNGKHVVIEVDVTERGIRSDGLLRADAKASSPAVRIAFESKHGPLVYATDRYVRVGGTRSRMDDWQHNVRAIALGLEALRKVDRYGISRSGEQYRGYKAISDGREPPLDVQAARALIDGYGGVRAALLATHPDHGGDPDQFHRVQQARGVLGV